MDSRRRLASLVLESGWSVADAARDSGVSRQCAHEWVKRARADGLLGMEEKSRRPKRMPTATSDEVVGVVLAAASEYPSWGPCTLHALLWPDRRAPISERTVARILNRAGRRVMKPNSNPKATMRFERDEPNELWQIDFKRVGHTIARSNSLSVIDDASRFCIALTSVPDQTLESTWSVLWEAFAEFGIPLQILSDNGPAFRSNATWRWSSFDLRLMLLGIRPTHGRPFHPQTQGKVERFHGTMEREILFERGGDVPKELATFRDRYNWVRPHHALDMRTPGSVYKPGPRHRPGLMPKPFFPEGAVLRKAGPGGVFHFQGQLYRLGKAFDGLPVGLLIKDQEHHQVVWGDFILGPLADFKIVKDVLS